MSYPLVISIISVLLLFLSSLVTSSDITPSSICFFTIYDDHFVYFSAYFFIVRRVSPL